MRVSKGQLQISAGDLAKRLACRHLTFLDLLAARGEIKRVYRHDPAVDVLEKRGLIHEAAYLAHLKDRGFDVVDAVDGLSDDAALERTLNSMKAGRQVIAQAYLSHERWQGRADVLLKVDKPCTYGPWSYEVVDTKLARDTRGGAILQLCLYSELVEKIQGCLPEQMQVVTPGNNFEPEIHRLQDYLAYYRFVKLRLETEADTNMISESYPDPTEHCEICNWWSRCNEQRRNDDHLSFVAGISKIQTAELRKWKVTTLETLSALPLPLQNRPERGAPETYVKIREQARVQAQFRKSGAPIHELLALEEERGLARLPKPSAGDIFLDFESDPFVETEGLEYLLGYVLLDEAGQSRYTAISAFNRVDERRAVESFIDTVMQRLTHFPDLHIYHFTHYEPTALKRLVGRYATRQDELDRMLRAGLFIDLHAVVKQSLRASVETYSLKALEVFSGYQRDIELETAKQSMRVIQCALELNDIASISEETFKTIESYNRDDCLSTMQLRNWLETLRELEVRSGKEILRPPLQQGDPSEVVDERRRKVVALMDRMLAGFPEDPAQYTPEQYATWLLAQMLEWHRREDKAEWWEYFRLCDLTDEERLQERHAVSGLEFVARIGGTVKSPIDRYKFPQQDAEIRVGDQLKTSSARFGKVHALNEQELTIDVKKTEAMKDTHPKSVFVHNQVDCDPQVESLFRLASWVADHSISEDGSYRAGRHLLLRKTPRLKAGSPTQLYREDAGMIAEARRLALQLDGGVLPVQGPPGAGKTFIGARMICALIAEKRKVGVTAMSHKVIRKLLDEVVKAAKKENLNIRIIEKVGELSQTQNPAITETKHNPTVLNELQAGTAQCAGGTAWLWSRDDFAGSVDVLFIDEAGQMSLADVIAVSQAAKSIVLLGDPKQLEQPLQGTHPPGVAVSALQHILGNAETMPTEAGLFLAETWRLAPSICEFTSQVFYAGRLKSHDQLDRQVITGTSRFAGSGLWLVPVLHEGNQSSSDEEADMVVQIVKNLLDSASCWTDRNNESHRLALQDVLIVAPYNAQVFDIYRRLPGARIGTVDKFQGQEAPVVIYSMTTSSPEDAPHGMEFLYNLNRLNVATSRARCACILVASPRLLEPECKTPRQMKLANALCRYLELAQVADIMGDDRGTVEILANNRP